MVSCASCGQGNPDGFRFCGACGAALTERALQREERKRISVLFCDLVGFTGRAETMDPEEVRALLQPPALLSSLDLPAEVEERMRVVLSDAPQRTPWTEGPLAALDRRFLDAAEIYARMPFRQAEADARVRAAEQLVAAGRRAEADDQLRLALAFWQSVGATRYIRQAEKLLAASA